MQIEIIVLLDCIDELLMGLIFVTLGTIEEHQELLRIQIDDFIEFGWRLLHNPLP